MIADPHLITPHSDKQERALFSEKPILVVGAGTQWGKTKVGAIRMKVKLHTFTEKTDNFIITSPTYKIMNQSTLPPFLAMMDGFGKYNKKEDVFEMHNGGLVFCRTERDPDSIVGITNVKHIWGDEAGKYGLYFWTNLQARADFCGCGIDLTTSPYALNWVWKELIKPWREGKRPDIDVIQAASWENPYHSLFDPEKLALKRRTMDPRRFNMIYGGEFGKMEGLVYDCWDDEVNLVDVFALPTGTRFVAGVDWGWTDPFVIKVRAITPDGRHYGISEFTRSHLTPPEQVAMAKQKRAIFDIKKFWCDPSQPGMIELFNKEGLPAEGANNSITEGVGMHYELIKTGKYKEFRDTCPISQDERETYHYPEEEDVGPDQNAKEVVPVDQGNHCMDADRYVTIMEYQAHHRNLPKTPKTPDQLKTQDRFKALTKGNRNRNTESWG